MHVNSICKAIVLIHFKGIAVVDIDAVYSILIATRAFDEGVLVIDIHSAGTHWIVSDTGTVAHLIFRNRNLEGATVPHVLEIIRSASVVVTLHYDEATGEELNLSGRAIALGFGL